jgi:hypothetical protein
MLSRRFATLLGLFLVVEGIWELFSPVVFGVFSSNTLHGVIHIALGVIGLWVARKGTERSWLIGVGGLLIVVGCCYFIPGTSRLVVSLLNVNTAVAIFNVIVGVVCLGVALISERQVEAARPA